MRYNTSVSGIQQLIKISRPRFWIYVFGPYIVGLAAAASGQNDFYSWKVFLFAVFFSFPANLLIYGVNDIFDYETDRINEKKLDYETLVSPDKAGKLALIILLTNLPFIVFSYFFSPRASLALLGFYFFSVFYSAPPIRAKTKPLLDSMFNILYLFPAVFAYKMLSGEYPPLQVFIAAGFWTMAMHAYSAIPDIEADKTAGIATIATSLGSTGTHLLCLILYGAAAALAFKYIGILSILSGLAYVAMILISMRLSLSDGVFRIYRCFPYLNAAAGFALFWWVAFDKFF